MTTAYQIITITAGGGTVDINDFAPADRFIVTSAPGVSLSSNWTIQNTSPVNYKQYEFLLDMDVDLNGNTITILGQSIPQEQSDKRGTITSYYDGSAFVNSSSIDHNESGFITPNQIAASAVEEAKIAAGAVTESKIGAGAVTADKLDASNRYESIVVPVSFESTELGAGYVVYFPYKCTLILIRTYVTAAIAGMDDASVLVQSSLGVVTGSPITIPLSSAIGYNRNDNFSGPNAEIAADSVLTLTTAKTTPGGKALLTVVVQRTV